MTDLHEPHEYAAAGQSEPERAPSDGTMEWLLWAAVLASGTALSACIVWLIERAFA